MEYIFKQNNNNIDPPKVLGSANNRLYENLKMKAQNMRDNPTKAEKLLWKAINKKQLGIKFRNQHIIDRFIVDFYAIKIGLAIEVDGDIHDLQIARDIERDNILNNLGVNILRLKNESIITNLDNVISIIKIYIKSPLGDLGAN